MKQLFKIAVCTSLLLLVLYSCNQKEVQLTGSMPSEMQGEYAYLSTLGEPEVYIDSIQVTDTAQFVFPLKNLKDKEAYLLTLKAIGETVPFVFDPQKPLTFHKEELLVRGNEESNALSDYLVEIKKMFQDDSLPDSAYFNFGKDFFYAHKNSPIGYYGFELCRMAAENPLDLENILNDAGERLQALPKIQQAKTIITNLKKTQPGMPFVDFEGEDKDGNKVKLSDYVGQGQYVLVDFWASWCGPCKGEIPGLKKLYGKYRSKGLAILGISVWDKKEDHLKAVKEEGIEWPQIITGKDNRTATEMYGIISIPQIMLIGPDGTILQRNLRGEAIEAAITPLYK
ncbi:MAG: TlpA disulfide reductase family protein [Porphyromonas sp.]|nr:TlpA disulfide reductase family protein [Porphyromonas sp.]